jgi:hypothetical protein
MGCCSPPARSEPAGGGAPTYLFTARTEPTGNTGPGAGLPANDPHPANFGHL